MYAGISHIASRTNEQHLTYSTSFLLIDLEDLTRKRVLAHGISAP